MREQNVKIYKYDELTEQAKDRARDGVYLQYWDDYTECAYTSIRNDLECIFPNSDLDIQFDFSCCQGSGVNIYGNVRLTDAIPVLQGVGMCPLPAEKIAGLLEYNDRMCFCFSDNRRYTYSMKPIDREQGTEWVEADVTDEEWDDMVSIERALCDYLEDTESDFYNAWACPSEDDIEYYIRELNREYLEDGTVFRW